MLTDSEAPSARVGPHPASDHSGRWSPEGGGAEKVYLQVPALKKPTDQFRPFQDVLIFPSWPSSGASLPPSPACPW